MRTKFRIVETEDYILAVSDKIGKVGDWVTDGIRVAQINCLTIDDPNKHLHEQITGYKPKNNAPKLDLPLLPDMVVEDDVEKLAKVSAEKEGYGSNDRWDYINGYTKCYESTNKKYSEEDLRKAIELSRINYKEKTFGTVVPKYKPGEIVNLVTQAKT